MNTSFSNNYERKVRKYYTNIHKAMIIKYVISQKNNIKLFETVH